MRQPPSKNLCLTRSIPCSHICVPSPQERTTTACLCPRHLIKLVDEATCGPTVTEIEAGLKFGRKESDMLNVSTNAEIVEVVEDESGNHLLAPILGIVIVIVVLLLIVVRISIISDNKKIWNL